MTTPNPKKDGKAPVASLVLDGSAKLLDDDVPISAGAAWDAQLKQELAKDLQRSRSGFGGHDKEWFPDLRRESEATQPSPKSAEARRSNWGAELDKGLKDYSPVEKLTRTEVTVKNSISQVSDTVVGMTTVEKPDEVLTPTKSAQGVPPSQSTPKKQVSTDVVTPSAPRKAAPQNIPVPSSPAKSDQTVQSPTSPKGPVAVVDIGAVHARLAAQWLEQQNRFGVPNAKKLSSDVLRIVMTEAAAREVEAAREAEQAFDHALHEEQQAVDFENGDGKKLEPAAKEENAADRTQTGPSWQEMMKSQVDPRSSFREVSKEKPVTKKVAAANTTETGDSWKQMMTSKIDPRQSFRSVKSKATSQYSAVRDAVPKATTRLEPTDSNAAIDHEDKDIPEPTLIRKPETWVERELNYHPGGWLYDVAAVFAVILSLLLIFLFFFGLLTASVLLHRFIQPACTYRAVSSISSLAPSVGLPDSCVLSANHITSTTSPVVKDPLGIERVVDWPLTLPQLKDLDHSVSHPVYPFSPINDRLKRSAAFSASELYVKHLADYGDKRVDAFQKVQESIAGLSNNYATLISNLLKWSSWSPRDLHNVAQGSTGLKQSIKLLWGPSLRFKTPLGHVKEKLQLPVKELYGNTHHLLRLSNATEQAIYNAKVVRVQFHLALEEAEEFFVDKCLSRRALSWSTVSKDIACSGWDPRIIKKSLKMLERHEDVMFRVMERDVNKLAGSIWRQREFYYDVLRELKNVKSRTYGNVTYDTLDSIRDFVKRVGDRMTASAGVLKTKMGK